MNTSTLADIHKKCCTTVVMKYTRHLPEAQVKCLDIDMSIVLLPRKIYQTFTRKPVKCPMYGMDITCMDGN